MAAAWTTITCVPLICWIRLVRSVTYKYNVVDPRTHQAELTSDQKPAILYVEESKISYETTLIITLMT